MDTQQFRQAERTWHDAQRIYHEAYEAFQQAKDAYESTERRASEKWERDGVKWLRTWTEQHPDLAFIQCSLNVTKSDLVGIFGEDKAPDVLNRLLYFNFLKPYGSQFRKTPRMVAELRRLSSHCVELLKTRRQIPDDLGF